MSASRVIIIGATGMIGGLALQHCLDRADVAQVTILSRRPVGISHPRLHEVLHDDFGDYSAVAAELAGHDVALFCLGAYTGVLPDDEFRRVTVDYALAFANALYAASPRAVFCFLSGQGADQSGRSRMAFARYKGEAEKGLLAIGFPRVHLFRPGYIYPVSPRREPNFAYRVMRALWPAVRLIYPNLGIASDALALAMVEAGLSGDEGAPGTVLENRQIRQFARRGR
ncbi:MAG: hypothetical protein KDB90_09400 [Planctomycetes bacterium]|nr:hypothetical protein [Planctomycetota bacterium]